MNSSDKIKSLIADVRHQVKEADDALERALQKRDDILATPITRDEVKANIAEAVDSSARRFKAVLTSTIGGRARKRNATGVRRAPDTIRDPANHSQLNIDAINFYFGDLIIQKANNFISEMEYFGMKDGLNEVDYNDMLNQIEVKIDDLKTGRDSLRLELDSILK